MKLQKIILSLASFIAFIYIGLTVYVVCVPSITTVAWVCWQVMFNKDWKGAQLAFTEKNFPDSNSAGGQVISDYGYSFKVVGSTEKMGEPNDLAQLYKLTEKKALLARNYGEHFWSSLTGSRSNLDFFESKTSDYQFIEAAASKPMTSDYYLDYDMYKFTPNDFSFFNNSKNKGIALALKIKVSSIKTDNIKKTYYFNKGQISGIETIGQTATGANQYNVEFCDDRDLNKLYSISFLGEWTEAEVDAAIGTIRFDQ